MTASPAQIAAAWRAFRGDRPGVLLGPGPAFVEAIEAAMSVADAERAAAAADEWRAYEEVRDAMQDAVATYHLWTEDAPMSYGAAVSALDDARAALDAAVRRLAGVADA